ncbi:MAG: peptidase S10 [Planctomycetes bacterium]|nr:peptidase S10 [Planctomycetota bacterium]
MARAALALLCSCVASIAAQEPALPPASAPPIAAVRSHELSFGERALAYSARLETLVLRDAAGEPEAEFVVASYLAREVDPARRPITFAFNGGPGSSSIWLHLGFVGPRRVVVPSGAQQAGAAPFALVDNAESLLEQSDLVFIDPVGTGFSRATGKGKNEDHWGVDEDARSVARFVQRWVTEHGRWASPKLVLGESYGGIRGALLARELQSGAIGMSLSGLILISPALDMALVDGQPADATYATALPSYAATAWYHDALREKPADLEAFLASVRLFVEEKYLPALFLGEALPADRREHLVNELERFTGIDAITWERANLRLSVARFRAELLRSRGLVVGRLDARYTGRESDDLRETPSDDPFSTAVGGAFTAALHQHHREFFGLHTERVYALRADFGSHVWKRPDSLRSSFSGYLDVGGELARAMEKNHSLRVFIGSGFFDLATTFYAAEVNVRRARLPRERVMLRHYPAGHMMYVNEESSARLAEDLRAFVAECTAPR